MKKKVSKLLTLVLALALTASLASCAKTTPPEATPTGAQAEYADQIVIGRLGDAAYLDPNASSIGGAEATVTQQIYEGLVYTGADGTIAPLLATDWTLSDDGLVYKFNLKPGVKFSDGRDVKGEDWVFSLLRARDCETSSYRFIAEAIDTVESDDATVTIALKYPSATFLANLANFNMVVGCKAYFEEIGEEEYAVKPLGTGPYMLKEWVKEEHILLEANPNYHEAGKPLTKEIKYTVVPDDNTRIMQLQAGQIDIANDVPFTMVDMVKADQNVTLEVFPSTQIRYLILNTTVAPFDDIAVRQALVQGLNKQEMSDLIVGEYGAPVAALVSETQGKWHNASLEVVSYNAEKAKKMLEDAGYTTPVAFTISIRSGSAVYEQIATLMKSQLDQAGFAVTIEMLERASLSDKYESLTHQATILQWIDDVLDPSGVTGWTVDYDQCNSWYTGLNDVELDALNAAANAEMDEAKRVEMYQEIQQKVYDNANVVPLFRNAFAYAYSNKVQNLYVSPFSIYFCKDLVKVK